MHLDVTNLDIHQVRTHDMSTANRIQIESSPLFSSEVTFAKTSPLSSDGETLLGSRPVWCHFLCVQQRHARLHYSTGGILGIVGRSLFIAWGVGFGGFWLCHNKSHLILLKALWYLNDPPQWQSIFHSPLFILWNDWFPPPLRSFWKPSDLLSPRPPSRKKKLKIFRLIKLCLVPWDIWPSVNRVKFQ